MSIKNTGTKIFIASVFVITKNWNQPIGEWVINNKPVVCLSNGKLARNERNKLLIQVTTLKNLKNSTLSKRSQSQKVHSILPFI